MRYLWLVVCVLLVACGSDDKKSEPKSYALNGFWNGQFDQSVDIRLLIYNGEVFALDAEQGYYGTLTYTDFNLEAKLTLSAKAFMAQAETSGEQITGSASVPYVLTGIYYSADVVPQLVGDYRATDSGEFLLNYDDVWNNESSLTALTGKWQAPETIVRIEPKGGRYEFRAVKPNGCTFNGSISLLNSNHNLYSVDMKERRGCQDSIRGAQGYAAINAEGELEFYLRSGGSLLFMTFTPNMGSTTPPVDDDLPDDGTGDEPTDEDNTGGGGNGGVEEPGTQPTEP